MRSKVTRKIIIVIDGVEHVRNKEDWSDSIGNARKEGVEFTSKDDIFDRIEQNWRQKDKRKYLLYDGFDIELLSFSAAKSVALDLTGLETMSSKASDYKIICSNGEKLDIHV